MGTELTPLPFRGAFVLAGARHVDSRGDFSRVLDLTSLNESGFDLETSYVATARNHQRGTVRGLHYQAPPHGEFKAVWCTTGSIYDVLVDARSDEPTFGRWISVELSASDAATLLVPPGVAHGYQTTEDETTVSYLISGPHETRSARTIRFSDPTLAIIWPLAVTEISEQDAQGASWTDQA